MTFDEYAALDATALAALVRAGEVSAAELRTCARDAIERCNPALNAVLHVLDEPQTFDASGAFAGVPFVIKELMLCAAAVPCRMGSRLTAEVRFPADTELMRRYRAAGLQLVGTTQSPELGYCATTEPVAFGPVHNPWRHGHSPGGSSGGSGAAVAARMVPLAHANDGGGSIRIPASCNGLVGLKPTRDRTPTGPDVSDPLLGHAIEFALTRSVRDCAALLDAVAGPDAGAPHIIAPPATSFLVASRQPPSGLRVMVLAESPFGTPVDPACAATANRTARLLADLGHHVTDYTGPRFDFEEFALYINRIWCTSTAAQVAALERLTGRQADATTLEAVTLTCARAGQAMSATDLLAAIGYVNRISRQLGTLFEAIDLLVTPTVATPPPPHGLINQNDASLSDLDWTRNTFTYAPFTPLFNSSGQPAISLPMGASDAGLPIGAQLVGGMGREDLLLGVAAALEEAEGWQARRPAPLVVRSL